MRRALFLFALLVTVTSAGHAQAFHTAAATPDDEVTPDRSELVIPAPAVDFAPAPTSDFAPAPAPVQYEKSATEAITARDVSARNLFAVVGAVVVVIALIALFS